MTTTYRFPTDDLLACQRQLDAVRAQCSHIQHLQDKIACKGVSEDSLSALHDEIHALQETASEAADEALALLAPAYTALDAATLEAGS